MKSLDFEKMEKISAGGWLDCAVSAAGLVVTIAGAAAMTTVTAGAGLIFVGSLWYSGISTGIDCGKALS